MTPPTTRYQCFLRAHAFETLQAPPNYRFMAWINRQWLYFKELHPEAASDQDAFDAWLISEFPPPAA